MTHFRLLTSLISLMKPQKLIGVGLAALIMLVAGGLALAFSSQWQTHFEGGNSDLNQWSEFQMNCSGQNHSVSGSAVRMRAGYGTDCYGAFYRDNAGRPGTFPTNQDVRVMWRWRYPDWGKYGTQAGQVTGRYGGPQYYGVSGVDTGNGDTDYAHVESSGSWGSWNVDNPMWRSSRRDTGWHVSTFDFICDGQRMAWFIDGNRFHRVTSGSALPPGHESRPYQFWFGNLISRVPSDGEWTNHDIDYVYIYAVERPRMNTPTPGSGGAQAVSWNAVANTPQPDGSNWGIEYQVRGCTDPNCGNVVGTSPWQSGTGYTFSGLEANRRYHYQARARWVGTPELVTCWGQTAGAQMQGVPELALAKSATAEAGPGQVISYTLILQNAGSAAASGVVVRDPLPQYITEPTDISGGGSVQGSEVIWNIGPLAAGQSVTLRWSGTVALDVPPSVTEIVNIATASDEAGNSDQAQAATRLLIPEMTLVKSAPAEVGPGEVISYTVVLVNGGNMSLPAVVVRDPIPQFILDPGNISHGGRVQGGQIEWDIGPVSPGESLVLSWQGRVDPAIPVVETSITNRVTAETGLALRREADATTRVLQPSMRVVKLANRTIMPGQVISYTILISNTGNTGLYGLQVEDPLPAYVTPGSISEGGYQVPGRIVWDSLGALAAGQSRTVSWQGRVDPLIPPEAGPIRNVARAATAGGLAEESEAVTELLQPGLALRKDASATAYAGGAINYILRLTNNGPGLARQIEVRDPLPAHTFFVPDVAPDINQYGTLEGNQVVWRLTELQPGQAVTLRWRAQVNVDVPPGMEAIDNQACATSLDSATRVCDTAQTHLLDPGLSLGHTCPPFAQAGDTLTYEIRIKNGTRGTGREVVVRLTPPPGTSYIPGSATNGGLWQGSDIVWGLGTLAAGADMSLAYRLALNPGLGDSLAVAARLSSRDEAEQEQRCVTALVRPALAIGKAAPAEAVANETIAYTLVVTNTGPVVAYHSRLTDTLPVGADYVPGSVTAGGAVSERYIVWQLGDLAPGQVERRRFEMVVHAPQGVNDALIYNEALATADRAVPVWADAVTMVPRPVLTLTKRAPAQIRPGERFTYTLRGANQGPGLARQALLKDSLPEGLIVLEDSIGTGGYYDQTQHAVIWPLGHLPAGTAIERDVTVLAPLWLRPGSRLLDNQAFLSSPDAAPAYAQATTAITGVFTVVGDKTATPYAEPGGRIDYAIQVHNGSPNVAANVVIRDPLPEFTTYLTGTASLPPAIDEEGQTLLWNLGTMPAGETQEVRFRVQLDATVPEWLERVTNVARVSYSGGNLEVRATTLLPAWGVTGTQKPTLPPTATPFPVEPSPVPPPTETPLPTRPPVVELPPTPTPAPLPGPDLRKTVWPEVVRAGEVSTVTWRLTFSNPTPLAIGGLVIRDPLPAGLVYASSQPGQGEVQITGDISQTVVVARLGDVAPGGQVEIMLNTVVISETAAGTVLTNRAGYTALNLDPGHSNEAQVVVEGAAVLPVTGGWLDPGTPQGQLIWGAGSVLVVLLGYWLKLGRGQVIAPARWWQAVARMVRTVCSVG